MNVLILISLNCKAADDKFAIDSHLCFPLVETRFLGIPSGGSPYLAVQPPSIMMEASVI